MSLTPKDWKSFQHYSDRKPAWIKLHRGLLDNYEFNSMPLASMALAPLLWLIASEFDNGVIPYGIKELSFRLRRSADELVEAINPLIDEGFFIADSAMLADCKRGACLERERQEQIQVQTETEGEDRSLRSRPVKITRETISNDDWPKDYRERFWAKYPRKQSRKSAFKALDRIRKSGETTFARLMAGIEKIPIGEPVFIPHAATWLNGARWDDESVKTEGNGNGYRGPRPLQDDSKSISAAAGRLAEAAERGEFTFGPRPSLLPAQDPGVVQLLPQRRSP